MDKPVIADMKPVTLTLEPGKYAWCACGQSQDQPFCDGSHQGSGFTPVAFEVEKEKKRPCVCVSIRKIHRYVTVPTPRSKGIG